MKPENKDELLGRLFMVLVGLTAAAGLCYAVFAVWATIHFAVKYW